MKIIKCGDVKEDTYKCINVQLIHVENMKHRYFMQLQLSVMKTLARRYLKPIVRDSLVILGCKNHLRHNI